jgi:hypothetical protein
MIDAEYQSLRAEIVGWQNFRFVLVGAATAFAAAIMAFTATSNTNPRLSLSLIVFGLSGAAALSAYAGRSNAKIGSYLQRFYEPRISASSEYSLGWEGRIRKFESDSLMSRFISLDRLLAITYAVLGIVSSLTLTGVEFLKRHSLVITDSKSTDGSEVILDIAWLFLIVAVGVLAYGPPRQSYLKRWDTVKETLPLTEGQAVRIELTESQLRLLVREEVMRAISQTEVKDALPVKHK